VRDGLMSRAEALETMTKVEGHDLTRENLKPVLDYLRLPDPIQEKFFEAT
jgi:hypothetical protein